MVRRIVFLLALLPVIASAHAAGGPLDDCRVRGIASQVKCGSLTRPLYPQQTDGPRFKLGFVVLPAKARRPLPDPVFFIAGGPGQSATALADTVAGMLSRLNFRRDIVLVDARGTGRSLPLRCSEISDELRGAPPSIDALLPLLATCRARLVREHGLAAEQDLGQVTTTQAMQDLDAVRAALGYGPINLVGISYGTRAALEYMRLYPQQVRRAVLDGVAPPDMGLIDSMGQDQQAALDAVFAACRRDAHCAAGGDLAAQWAQLRDGLPRTIRINDPLTGQPDEVKLTPWMLESAVTGVLYQPALAAALPEAIRRAANADFSPLAGLVARSQPRDEQAIALAMHFGVVCAEDYPRHANTPDAAKARFGAGARAMYAAVCPRWPRAAVDPEFTRIKPSPVPVLLLGGGLDPVTPPRHMDVAARALGPQAQIALAPNLGHNVLGASPCARDLVHGFVNAEATRPTIDDRCLREMPAPAPFRPLQGKEARK